MIIRASNNDDNWLELEDELSKSSILIDVINAIFSETGEFEDVIFSTANDFYDILVSYEPKDIATKFVNGVNLDTGKSPAKPEAKYFRFDDDDDVESTNYPEDYYEYYIDDVVNWFKDNLDTAKQMKLPESVFDIIKTLD